MKLHTKCIILAAIIVMHSIVALQSAFAEPVAAHRESSIKAGMVLNFIRFTEWPEPAFESHESSIVVTAVGDQGLNPELEEVMKAQSVRGRRVIVRRIAYPKPAQVNGSITEAQRVEFREEMRKSHVVFFGDSERDRVKQHLADLDDTDVLTVGDMPKFAEQGGMLGLTIRRDRVAFDANPDAIQMTELKVSSQLLRLARTVKTEGK